MLSTALAGAAPAPKIVSVTSLSSAPVRFSLGAAGPINRFAFDVSGIEASQVNAGVPCRYASGLRYRCRAEVGGGANTEPRRIVVDVPDLNRGALVTVTFDNGFGVAESSVEIANPPQTVHEIESMALPGGGAWTTGPDGARAPLTTLLTWQARSAPALVVEMPYQPERCDALYAQWVTASATDPVFSSEFGALNGAVAALRPVSAGSPVRPDNLPLWLITYVASATRVQFIAHYEVTYKVGVCAERAIR
ncbi:MAG TPA: hypothetical protein VFS58_17195 [Steroidobacteraceae bacterium]|nr:hypothetical protein [Steroidobacteraceae bacterium]